MSRRAVSAVVASIILIGIGLFLALSFGLIYREAAISQVRAEVIEFVYMYCADHVSMGNARWQIITYVQNRGTQSVQLIGVFVNDREIDVYGLVYGGSLGDGALTGTDLPVDGLNLQTGEGAHIVVWIGEDLFSSGTNVDINFNTVNSVVQKKSIRLK